MHILGEKKEATSSASSGVLPVMLEPEVLTSQLGSRILPTPAVHIPAGFSILLED